MAQDATRASAVNYFYGRISRDEAESILQTAGCKEGQYLLRENVSCAGNYALSICHNGRIHHYCIERQPDGSVMIPDGRKFAGPVELIHHHSQYLDGFLTKPKMPCARPTGTVPMAWPGVTMLELEQILLEEAEAQKLNKRIQLETALGPQRQKFVSIVAKKLHAEQPWYHGNITREAADRAISSSAHRNGKFLVREKDRGASFALSLSHQNSTKHYRIDKRKTANGEVFAIEEGPTFENLMDLVAHYYNKSDGLLCKLSVPCEKKGYVKKERKIAGTSLNPIYGMSIDPLYGGSVRETGISRSVLESDAPLDEPDQPDSPLPALPAPRQTREAESIYNQVRMDGIFMLSKEDLVLEDKLGAGNFGSVMKGTYKHRRNIIPVAVKVLKTSDMPSAEAELMKEAKMMANLDNEHIVRMIGVCKMTSVMLVLELASLGQLNKYLKKSQLSMSNVLELMHQVAKGMAYLESKNYVHRDLAARNVLLVDEHHAKISDFGMSKALGFDNQYYKAQEAGKWPIKWYAPECIFFFKFDSKSDVWSYGVTMWEATSYGDKPYRGLKGSQIIELIDQGQRLEKPPNCPSNVFDIMNRCWKRLPEERPTFSQLVTLVERVI